MEYKGFYINLDRSTERRAEIENQLAAYGFSQRYQRFSAAEGNVLKLSNTRLNPGEIGCFTSHYLLLRDNLSSDRHLHITEDDTIFAPGTEAVIHQLIGRGELDNFDILFADIALQFSNDAFCAFKATYDRLVTRDATGKPASAAFQILSLSPLMAPAASSFLIGQKSIKKIYDLFDEEIKQGMRKPIDTLMFENIRAGKIKAGFIFPFITSAKVEHTMTSTVRGAPDSTMRFTACNLARYSFFIGCDMEESHRLFQKLFPLPPAEDRHAQLLSQILSFSLLGGA